MKLSKRIAIYVLCGTLCMGSVFGAYSQSVRASAVLPVAFAVEEVIGTVLSLLGIKFAWDAAGTAVENWDKYTEWAGGLREDILNTWQKAYDADIYKQLAKEFDRALDSGLTGLITISGNVWSALKDWANGVYQSVYSSTGNPSFINSKSVFAYDQTGSVNGHDYDHTEVIPRESTRICGLINGTSVYIYGTMASKGLITYYYLEGQYQVGYNGTNSYIYDSNNVAVPVTAVSFHYVYAPISHTYPIFNSQADVASYIRDGIMPGEYVPGQGQEADSDLTTVKGVNDLYDRDKAVGAYDVLTPGRVIGDAGTVTGDVTVDTAKEDAIAGVWAGDIPWVDFMDNIGAIPIDITTDLVIDKDDGASGDEKIEDKYTPPVAPPADMDSFTANLRGIFPFCIPFDLVDAFKVFTASKIAPVFSIPFKVPSLGVDQKWEIDMSKFESVIEIFRVMETIGFIVGLVLLTRNIIRG